jgi:hypothetical protein
MCDIGCEILEENADYFSHINAANCLDLTLLIAMHNAINLNVNL